MTSFQLESRYGLLAYRSIYPNIWWFCEHSFCTIGNGKDWIDGKLIHETPDPEVVDPWKEAVAKIDSDERRRRKEEQLKIAAGQEVYPTSQDLLDERAEERRILSLQEIEILENDWNHLRPECLMSRIGYSRFSIYDVCEEYAAILNLPEAIDESWRDAGIKFMEVTAAIDPAAIPIPKHLGGHQRNLDSLKGWQALAPEVIAKLRALPLIKGKP